MEKVNSKLLDFLSESKDAFELYLQLYNRRYKGSSTCGSSGPSISSYCRRQGNENNCGCWVHHLLNMINGE